MRRDDIHFRIAVGATVFLGCMLLYALFFMHFKYIYHEIIIFFSWYSMWGLVSGLHTLHNFSVFATLMIGAVGLAPALWLIRRFFRAKPSTLRGNEGALRDALRHDAVSVVDSKASALGSIVALLIPIFLGLLVVSILLAKGYFDNNNIDFYNPFASNFDRDDTIIGTCFSAVAVLFLGLTIASTYLLFKRKLVPHVETCATLCVALGTAAIYLICFPASVTAHLAPFGTISDSALFVGDHLSLVDTFGLGILALGIVLLALAVGYAFLVARQKNILNPLAEWGSLFSIDARALGVFRIFYGGLFMVDIIRRLPYLDLMYTAEGVLPNKTIHAHPFSNALFSVLNSFDGAIEVTIFFYVALLFSFLFTIGCYTKTFQFLASVCIISIHTKNVLVENGGDQVMNLFVIWMLFLPMGIRYSVDSLRKSLRSKETCAADLNDRSIGANPRMRVWSLAVLACLCQLAVIYFFNAVEKSGPVWRDGNAMYYIMQMDRQVTEFAFWARFNVPYGGWVGMNASTWILEGLSALFILSPIFPTACRRIAFVMLLALHIGIAAIMNVGMFSPAMVCAYPILMTSPDFAMWKRWLRRCASKPLIVFYDPDCGFCMKTMRMLKRFDCLELLTFADRSWSGPVPENLDGLRERSIVVWREGENAPWIRQQALGRIVLALPCGFLLAWVFFLPLIGNGLGALYESLAKRRTSLSRFFGEPACDIPTPNASAGALQSVGSPVLGMFRNFHWAITQLALFLLILFAAKQMLSSNKYVTTITKEWESGSFKQEPWIRNLLRYPRNFQKWNMFAPNPPRGEGWVVVDACTAGDKKNGIPPRNIDPFSGKAPVFGPVDFEAGYDFGQHWRIYSKRIVKKKHKSRREALRQYLLKRHRFLDLEKEERITEFDVYWMYHRSPEPDEWYKPVGKDHWTRKWARYIGAPFGEAASLDQKAASWARLRPRYRKDGELYTHPEYLRGYPKCLAKKLTGKKLKSCIKRAIPKPTCYKIASHHPFPGKKRVMACKRDKSGKMDKNAVQVPKACNRPEPASKASKRFKKAGRTKGAKKTRGTKSGKKGGKTKAIPPRQSLPKTAPRTRIPSTLRALPPPSGDTKR